ncbi:MAG: phage integrase SAM-like domain-containing protein [Phaeodactylibacter xiamenensis]|uniref:Tyr recombinase domain-containing protein n=1 Tax=Phaeodactylibacter xiamenensis TaxID=1524460 RepID=A0A098S0Q0_9BACT|nr:tyrosine-type recombinase/integrase [Phaeodactylibacter xiamenensis]KGE85919.1 hypothetical protein IX84_25265 [Phaeodactylibacter xiamenensis]MCR9051269.1 site-specific integrase [bacterium]
MTLRHIINDPPRQDGTYTIRLYASYQGERRYFPTGLAVEKKYWDKKRGEVSKKYVLAKQYNRQLLLQKRKIEQHILDGGQLAHYGEKDKSGSMVAFLEAYIESNHGLKVGTVKGYRTALNKLKQYLSLNGREDISWNEIDKDFYYSFSDFILENGVNWSGLTKHLRVYKKVMRIAEEKGLHHNKSYKAPWFKTRDNESSNKIFLTKEEIALIENLDLSNMPQLERERDRFLVAYYFIMRYSDVVRLSKASFFGNGGEMYMNYVSQKTDIKATVPVKAAAWKLCEAYNFDFSFTANQVANRSLKQIASLAGINQLVAQGDRTGPKCMFVTFHTARRSAATNLRLMGASMKTIADIGGWKKLSTVDRYLRASTMDSAKLARDLDFFR